MGSEVREGFVRQRRNLIAGSFLLFFTQISGISISELNVFGNKFEFDHPHSIEVAMWVITVYWFVRYYQYFREMNSSQEIKSACRTRFNDYLNHVAFDRLKAEHPELLVPPESKPSAEVKLEMMGFSSLEVRHHFIRGHSIVEIYTDDGKSISREVSEPIQMVIDKKYLQWPRTKAKFSVFINTIMFTEYIFPYLVFLLPVFYGGYSFARHALG